MAFEIYVKNNTGAWNLEASAESKEEITKKYADIIQFININKLLLIETLPYTVTYDSETREYSASYPQEQP